MEPKWLTLAMVRALHSQSIAGFGGSPGIRDEGLLESAVDRPRNVYSYGDAPSLYDLAASYCVGVIKNHPFVDGNKRTGLLAANAFLDLNGYRFTPEETDVVNVTLAVADGTADEGALAQWLSDFSIRKTE